MECIHCKNEMVKGCNVNVEGVMYGIKISEKRKGFFNKVSAKPKAAVCSNCGYVAFYMEDYKSFRE
ncbi:MAG: nucleic acid-binding protein [Bacillota bacterium]